MQLSNGSTIDISNADVKKNDADVQVDPISGNFVATGTSYSGSITVSFTTVDYQEKFEKKRQGMHDIVADGDGLTKEMVRDLVKIANLAIWQASKDGE